MNKPTFDEHIKHIMRPRSYGTHVELQAMATYYQVPIYIYTRNRQGVGYHWDVVKPICEPHQFRVPFMDDDIMERKYDKTHIELFFSVCHYNCIVSIFTGCLHEVEPVIKECCCCFY